MTEQNENLSYDTSIIYDYKEYPDKSAGVCDNCGNKHFKSKAENYTFLRECRHCGMKKRI